MSGLRRQKSPRGIQFGFPQVGLGVLNRRQQESAHRAVSSRRTGQRVGGAPRPRKEPLSFNSEDTSRCDGTCRRRAPRAAGGARGAGGEQNAEPAWEEDRLASPPSSRERRDLAEKAS